MVEPIAEALAMAEPDTAPNIIEAPTSTIPSPPRTRPIAASATRTSRSAIPARYIRSPAKMKKGIAIRVKTLIPAATRWTATMGGISIARKQASAAASREKATGTPMTSMAKSTPNRTRSSISRAPLHWHHPPDDAR